MNNPILAVMVQVLRLFFATDSESLSLVASNGAPVFTTPQRVIIRGYGGEAMEPFLTREGRYLLFNNRNDPRTDTNLHFATRIDDRTFQYGGELAGANSKALDAVASVDHKGRLFFISTRSYNETLSTLYEGRSTAAPFRM